MRFATYKDIPDMTKILVPVFETDPLIQWFIGNPRQKEVAERRRLALVRYLCISAISINKAWISDDGKGVSLWRDYNDEPKGIRYIFSNIEYLLVCGIESTIRTLTFGEKIHALFPEKDYRYLWMIGISPEARGTGIFKQLVLPVIDDAKRSKLDVVLETAVERNVSIYNYYGFKTIKKISFKDSPEVTVMIHKAET
jgi:GNAT superfamily N-acetyltransferase